jgi:hypothetical protein
MDPGSDRDDVEGTGVGSVVSVMVFFKPQDVVFAQEVAQLHFDGLERDAVRVGQSVHHAQWDVDGSVFGQRGGFVAVGNFVRAGHHDPVLGPVVVFLHAEAVFGFNLDALDFEVAVFVDTVVLALVAVHFAGMAHW